MNSRERIFKNRFFIFLIAVICNLLWASAIPFIKIGYESFNITDTASKLYFAGIRFTFAGILVIIFNSILNKKIVLPKKENIFGIVCLGVIQTAAEYLFFYISLSSLSGTKGSILNSAGNFFAIILAHFCFSDDKLNFKKICGGILGLSGVALCNISSGGFDFGFSIKGEGFILIAAFCFALGNIITKKIAKNSNPSMLTGYQLILGGLILTLIGLIFGGNIVFSGFKSVLILFYLSFLSSVAFSLWAILLKYNHVGKIAVFGFLNPVFGVILSYILLDGEVFNFYTMISLVLVSLGIFVVNFTFKKQD